MGVSCSCFFQFQEDREHDNVAYPCGDKPPVLSQAALAALPCSSAEKSRLELGYQGMKIALKFIESRHGYDAELDEIERAA